MTNKFSQTTQDEQAKKDLEKETIAAAKDYYSKLPNDLIWAIHETLGGHLYMDALHEYPESIVAFLQAVSCPETQATLIKAMGEYSYKNFIEAIGKFNWFLNVLNDYQHKAILLAKDIEENPDSYSIEDLENFTSYFLSEPSRKVAAYL